MPEMPTPLKVVLGIAATAADEARKLPETIPAAVTNVPVLAVSTAMQASLKVQQRLAELAARGEAVLAQLRGTSEDAPGWATFDEPPVSDSQPPRAAFDRIDYDSTGYAEGDAGSGRWDAVGAAESDAILDSAIAAAAEVSEDLSTVPPAKSAASARSRAATRRTEARKATAPTATASKSTAPKAAATKTTPTQAAAANSPASKPRATKATATKTTATKTTATKQTATKQTKASPAKVTRSKAAQPKPAPTKSSAPKPAPPKAAPTKAAPAKPNKARARPSAASNALADDLARAVREFSSE